ncbi:otoconin-90 isoform X1 [Ranitomeya variabilis]|uniref:otoconin-90 isoform X1 n=1 Tax=Ranitomeya variabilis TaxID=490064 RepID=UPI0040579278
MLQRPYTMMPLWTGNGLQNKNISITTQMTISTRQVPYSQVGPSRRTSLMNAALGNVDRRQTIVSTSPHRRTSLEMTPMRLDSESYDRKDATTPRMAQVTNGIRHDVPLVTAPVLQVLIPHIKPTVDSPRISFHAYTKSRCRQTKLEVSPPSVTSVFPRISSCVMELCRFYQQCLCTIQGQYSRHKKQRQCVQFYSWYLKNATYICEKLQRKPHKHKTTYSQESGASPMLSELSDLPIRNINNFTFDGVFKNIESVTSFLDCLGSHFTWLQVIFTNFPALLNFVSKLKCVTGLCPRDLEDYGCACRYELEGLPIDAADSCCFQHRKCYEEALEMDCVWDPSKISADVTCLTKNLTCESGSGCEKLLCDCDKAAIECFVNTHVNSSLKGMDITFCPAPVTVAPEITLQNGDVIPNIKLQQNRSVDTMYGATQEGEMNSPLNDVAAQPSAEEVTADLPSSTSPPGTEATKPSVAGSDTPEGTPKAEDPSSRDAAMPISESPGDVLNTVMTAPDSTSRPSDVIPTKSGFKIVEESTLRSALSPLSAATETESVEQVCDRFHFQRVKEDGNIKSDLPLLGEMLYCLTGRCPEEFESYGCYCGREGTGNPKDVLDSCCFSHQCCIEHLKKLGCAPDRNVRSEVVCVDHKPTCVGWSICDKLVCACDKAAAECMAAAPFNDTMRSLNRRQCQGASMLCRNVASQDTPERAMGQQSDSSDSEDSSEEQSPMRDIVSGSLVPRGGGRRTRSILVGN